MNVKELAVLLEGLPPEMPVCIHLGWDLAITETEVDDEGLVLFADDSDVTAVNRAYLAALIDGRDDATHA